MSIHSSAMQLQTRIFASTLQRRVRSNEAPFESRFTPTVSGNVWLFVQRVSAGGIHADVLLNHHFAGDPVTSTTVDAIDLALFDLGLHSIPLSVRWTGYFQAPSEESSFIIHAGSSENF